MTYKIKPLEEAFENPFDDIEKKKKKIVSIKDTSDLAPRREIFNINRVMFTKRPNAEYTLLAKTQFAEGEIIEICPIIFVGVEAKGIDRLKEFVFEIEKRNGGMYGIVLGYGSLYKHSDNPNVSYAYNRSNRQMYFIAARPIQAQEELTINYGKDYWNERASFGTVAPQNETPAATDENQVEESMVQPNSDDITGEMAMKAMSSPNNPHNPVRSGVAIQGVGQG